MEIDAVLGTRATGKYMPLKSWNPIGEQSAVMFFSANDTRVTFACITWKTHTIVIRSNQK